VPQICGYFGCIQISNENKSTIIKRLISRCSRLSYANSGKRIRVLAFFPGSNDFFPMGCRSTFWVPTTARQLVLCIRGLIRQVGNEIIIVEMCVKICNVACFERITKVPRSLGARKQQSKNFGHVDFAIEVY